MQTMRTVLIFFKLTLNNEYVWTSRKKKNALPKILLPFLQTSTKIALIPFPLPLGILDAYLSSADFFSKSSFSKNSFRNINIIIVSNSLDADQA